METLTTDQFLEKISNGKVFSVSYLKKDGSPRHLVGRLGVKKDVKGTGMPWDAAANFYLPVFDFQKKAYRMVNLRTINKCKINGQTFQYEFNG